MLTVTVDGAPVYAVPATDAAVTASLRVGDRLAVLERVEDWLLVRTPSGVRGYVQPSALVAGECTADRAEPVLVEEPVFRFDEDPPHGRVVLEAEYTADGRLAGTRVLENSVGDPSYVQRTIDDLGKIRFLPPTADCKALPFFYTFTREF